MDVYLTCLDSEIYLITRPYTDCSNRSMLLLLLIMCTKFSEFSDDWHTMQFLEKMLELVHAKPNFIIKWSAIVTTRYKNYECDKHFILHKRAHVFCTFLMLLCIAISTFAFVSSSIWLCAPPILYELSHTPFFLQFSSILALFFPLYRPDQLMDSAYGSQHDCVSSNQDTGTMCVLLHKYLKEHGLVGGTYHELAVLDTCTQRPCAFKH